MFSKSMRSSLRVRNAPSNTIAIMKSFLVVSRVAFFLLLTIVISNCHRSDTEGTSPGDYFPPLKLETLEGASFDITSLRGKYVLVNMMASWCPPCIAELPDLNRLHVELTTSGFAVVGIAVDDNKVDLSDVLQKFPVTYPVVLDIKGVAKAKLQLQGMPESFLLDPEGRIVMFVDPEGSELVSRVVGGRAWGGARFIAYARSLISEVGTPRT